MYMKEDVNTLLKIVHLSQGTSSFILIGQVVGFSAQTSSHVD
jgi:hypothetical protein